MLTGGLAVSSLIKPSLCFSERFEYFYNKIQSFVGQNEYVGFNNSLSLSLKDHSNRLYAIGHYLRENKCFNKEYKVLRSQFYLQFKFSCLLNQSYQT